MCKGFLELERESLTTEALYLRLSTTSNALKPFPDSLTLHYLPRINGTPLDINGSSIRPDSPAFVTLHRMVAEAEAVYGSRERVTAFEGAIFEVYLGDSKLLRGVFRKDESSDEWRLECRSLLEAGIGVREVEVCVAVRGQPAMREKVEVVVRRRKRRGGYCFKGLEEIPEEKETESDGTCRCCECSEGEDEDGERGSVGLEEEREMEVEGVSWAVDVGIWVMCLGVGYLVTKASSKSLRRTRLF